jgi:hypothetical protein
MRVIGERPQPETYQRLDDVSLSTAELRTFAGRYVSTELQVTYTLAPRDSGLVLQMPGRADILLSPIFPDAFEGSLVGVVKFTRGAAGAPTGFTLNTSGVRRLRFERAIR